MLPPHPWARPIIPGAAAVAAAAATATKAKDKKNSSIELLQIDTRQKLYTCKDACEFFSAFHPKAELEKHSVRYALLAARSITNISHGVGIEEKNKF